MVDYRRYAVYYAPPAGSDLARFGASWLGWDAQTGTEVAHPDAGGLDVRSITQAPRKYGFHGTLKAPFQLADGVDPQTFAGAVQDLARRRPAFSTQHLVLKRLGRFIALVPSRISADLAALAATCVKDLDEFRGPLHSDEITRRRAAGLTPAQDENLMHWGYPYVLGEFRFHLTLTGALEEETSLDALSELGPLTAPYCTGPFEIREICLFGEADDGRFHLVDRYPLTG